PMSELSYALKDIKFCLEKFIAYGIKASRLGVLSTAEYFDPDIDIDTATLAAENLVEGDRVGYLEMVLRSAQGRGIAQTGYSGPISSPSPIEWGMSVDALAQFASRIGAFKAVKDMGSRAPNFLNSFTADLAKLADTGKMAQQNVSKLRQTGTEYALDRYKAHSVELSGAVADAIVDAVSHEDLDITDIENEKIAVLRSPGDRGGFRSDGTTRYSIKYYNNDYFVAR